MCFILCFPHKECLSICLQKKQEQTWPRQRRGSEKGNSECKKSTVYMNTYTQCNYGLGCTYCTYSIHDNVLYFRLLCASPSWTQWVNLTPACMTCTGCPATPMVRETDRYNCSLWHTYTRLIYHTYVHALADARACKGWCLQRRVMVRCFLAHVPTATDVWSARLRMTVVKLTHRTHTSQSLIYIGF